MAPEDREKISFITPRGVYYYKVMLFGLIDAGATFQRIINKVFAGQLRGNMEAYVNDLMVKSLLQNSHLQDIEECFATIRKHNMKLNPDKCTFALDVGKFLRFIISRHKIEANPEKIKAIMDMQAPRTMRIFKS